VAAVAVLRLNGPQVDDATHPGSTGRRGKVLHPLLLKPVKIAPRPHGVDQIEDGIDACQGRLQSRGFEAVGKAKLDPSG